MEHYAALFFSALISSTLFPGGSEALLVYRLQQHPENLYMLVFIATLGNVLGSMITYLMGKYGFQWGYHRLGISSQQRQRAQAHFQRFGAPALLFAWLPVVGDPLCLVAGSLRYPIIPFTLLISLGKAARYGALALPFLE